MDFFFKWKNLNNQFDKTKEIEAVQFETNIPIQFTTDLQQVASCNIFIITVPTPIDKDKQPDLSFLVNASKAVASILKKGDKVKITIPDLKKEVQAKVSFAGRNIDPLSRTFVLEAELPSSAELRPNMTALIKIVYASYPSVIAVPVNTVQNIKGEKVVFVAEASGDQTVARRKVVTVDGVFDGLAQVQGLAAGERVITAGFQGLTEGQYLKVQ